MCIRDRIDQPDCWAETSGSAMFTFAFIKGVKNGWLNAKEYAPLARKAWLTSVSYTHLDVYKRQDKYQAQQQRL